MTNHDQAIDQELNKFEAVYQKALEILGDTPLAEVGEVRADTELPNVTPEQTEALYEVMGELGFGRESDVTPAEAGMQAGYAANIEGGKPNKIEAELKVILASDVPHGPIVLTLSSERQAGDDEREFLASRGLQNTENDLTEMQVGTRLLGTLEQFVAAVPKQVAFGYDPQTLQTTTSDHAGQAVLIGYINDQPVYTLEVTRNHTEDGKYSQPNTADMLHLSTAMLAQDGHDVTQVAVVTGGLYGPTRLLDTAVANQAFAAKENPIVAGMVAYGREAMSQVTGKPSARPAEQQLFSEIKKLEDKVRSLRK